MKLSTISVLVVSIAVSLPACAVSEQEEGDETNEPSETIEKTEDGLSHRINWSGGCGSVSSYYSRAVSACHSFGANSRPINVTTSPRAPGGGKSCRPGTAFSYSFVCS